MPRVAPNAGSKRSGSSPRPSRRVAVLACALAVGALWWPDGTAAAQAPEDRQALEQFRDSLATASDTVSLLRLEASLIEHAKLDRQNPILHLRLGFLALRLGTLGGKSHFEDAGSEFEWAAELEPDWPYPLLGLGVAERELGRGVGSVLFGVKAMLGKDQDTKAVTAFAGAAQVDPGFVPALTELAQTTDSMRLNRRPDLTLAAFRRAATTGEIADPEYHLYRGRVERAFGDLDSALAAFQRYLSLGGTRGLALLEIARSRLALGQTEALEPYFEGAAWEGPELAALYRSDIAPIATDGELADFDSLDAAGRARFLRKFWLKRDAADLRSDGERVTEHYRRLVYARRHFRLGPFRRVYDYGERYRSGSREFDDRGIIYVRHGPPLTRQVHVTPAAATYGAESWTYVIAEQMRAFHFVGRDDPSDYRLVDSPLRMPVAAREEFLLTWAPRAVTADVSLPMYATNLRVQTLKDIDVATTTDSYELRFAKPIEAFAQVLVTGAREGRNTVHVAYAITVGDLVPTQLVSGWLYPVHLRLAVLDSAGAPVVRVDTTSLMVASRALGPDDHLLGHLALPLPAGAYTLRFALSQGDVGGIFPREAIDVRIPGEALDLSDLVVGTRKMGLSWVSPGRDTLFFDPFRVVSEGAVMELYYEVYGLTPEEPYETEIKVEKKGGGLFRKVFGGGGKKIRLGFSETAPGRLARSRRTIDLEGLKPGEYVLTITARKPSGGAAERQHFFVIEER
ncbi:MAG: GWxTD domain-containing protein [Gemmatimonadales bacterium]|nr:MAG: GWxTD domain-containing protein [Gemmatimonadales bacterium]